MRTLGEVEKEMEFKRQRMIDAGERLGLTHPETVRLSQEVDKLHNEHMKIQMAAKAEGRKNHAG